MNGSENDWICIINSQKVNFPSMLQSYGNNILRKCSCFISNNEYNFLYNSLYDFLPFLIKNIENECVYGPTLY